MKEGGPLEPPPTSLQNSESSIIVVDDDALFAQLFLLDDDESSALSLVLAHPIIRGQLLQHSLVVSGCVALISGDALFPVTR